MFPVVAVSAPRLLKIRGGNFQSRSSRCSFSISGAEESKAVNKLDSSYSRFMAVYVVINKSELDSNERRSEHGANEKSIQNTSGSRDGASLAASTLCGLFPIALQRVARFMLSAMLECGAKNS